MSDLSKEGKAYMKIDEGYRGKPYLCTAGHLTVGWGHNLDAHGLKLEFVIMLLEGVLTKEEIFDKVLEIQLPGFLIF